MREMRLFRLTAVLVALLAMLVPSALAASGAATTQVYKAYQDKGKINPCTFSDATLKQALKGVTPDLKQYAPDFPDAISQAIEDRASGACDAKPKTTSTQSSAPAAAPTSTDTGSSTPAPAKSQPAQTPAQQTPAPAAAQSQPTTTPAPTPVVDPAPAVADDAIPAAAKTPAAVGSDGAPAPLLVLAIIAGVVLLLGALWAAARSLGFDPPWLARWRHATEEAGYRASAAWSEFTDWVRLGR